MKRTKRNYLIVALIIVLMSLAIGYAAFSDTLTISGTTNAKGTFDMIFQSASMDTANAQGIDKVNSSASIDPTNPNVVNVNVKDLEYPGAGVDVTVVIKNNGTVDAILKDMTFTGVDDTDIEIGLKQGLVLNEIVPSQGTCTVTFYVKWKTNSELKSEKSLDFSATLNYEQYTPEFNGTTSHVDA